MTSIIQLIRSSHAALRKSERKVADYVLGHADDVIHMRIVDLAQEARVSEPTVVRFCRAIGYNSFQSFKLALAQYVAHHPREATAAAGLSAYPLIDDAIGSLQQLRQQLDADRLARAGALLTAARRVLIAVAGGGLEAAAGRLQSGLWQLGLPALVTDQASPLTLAEPDLLVLLDGDPLHGGVRLRPGGDGESDELFLPATGPVASLLLVELLVVSAASS